MSVSAQANSGFPRRWLVMPAVSLVYFSMLLIPNWVPKVAASGLFVFYVLSVFAALAVFALLAAFSGVALLSAAARRQQAGRIVQPMGKAALASLLSFAVVFLAARVVGRSLPTGSHLMKFEANVWRDPSSTTFAEGGATPRQKMLGDVVARILPGRSRSEIEADLGPSLDSPYFRAGGRDLIYILGPERDKFMRIDSEWLLIWVDQSGRFTRYDVVTD